MAKIEVYNFVQKKTYFFGPEKLTRNGFFTRKKHTTWARSNNPKPDPREEKLTQSIPSLYKNNLPEIMLYRICG